MKYNYTVDITMYHSANIQHISFFICHFCPPHFNNGETFGDPVKDLFATAMICECELFTARSTAEVWAKIY